MPTANSYEEFLLEALPEVIETEEQYDSAAARLSELVRKGRRRTADETRLMKLLAVLVRDYDERHALPPAGMAPAEALRYLLEQSGKTVVDLLGVFGQRSHVNEALNGRRKISAEQAQKLAKLFSVNPGVFSRLQRMKGLTRWRRERDSNPR